MTSIGAFTSASAAALLLHVPAAAFPPSKLEPSVRAAASPLSYSIDVRSSTQLEVAPAGTYKTLYSMIEKLKQRDFVQLGKNSPWLDSVMADSPDLKALPQGVRDFANDVLKICSNLPVSEPSIADDDGGGVEIFFKERNNALLLTISPQGELQVFGDSKKEQWRCKYSLSGRAWKRHLPRLVSELSIDDGPS
jgi:hypothetical protein